VSVFGVRGDQQRVNGFKRTMTVRSGGDVMKKDKDKVYEAPSVLTFGNEALSSVLGPSLSCTGFGGSTHC